MMPTEDYLTNTDYRAGYDAACLCEEKDKTKTPEWIRGFNDATEDLDLDNQRFI